MGFPPPPGRFISPCISLVSPNSGMSVCLISPINATQPFLFKLDPSNYRAPILSPPHSLILLYSPPDGTSTLLSMASALSSASIKPHHLQHLTSQPSTHSPTPLRSMTTRKWRNLYDPQQGLSSTLLALRQWLKRAQMKVSSIAVSNYWA